MNDSAINQIQENVTLDVLVQTLNSKGTHYPTIALPDGFRIKDLEEYMPERSSYRVRFETISMDAFVNYCELECGSDTKCFIDTKAMLAKTHFDLGSKDAPLHNRHTAKLVPEKTAAYLAMIDFVNRQKSQREISEFIEDWENNLNIFDEFGNKMSAQEASRAVRMVTIERIKKQKSEVGNFSEESDVMERVEASSVITLPATFRFSTPPYLDFKDRDFGILMSININEASNSIGFKLRILKLEQIQEEIGEEFLGTLEASFPAKIKTFIGRI